MNSRIPTFSIEFTPENIHEFPQLSHQWFAPEIIEKYKNESDPYIKAQKDWFRDNPIINGKHFLPPLPPEETIIENDRQKYLLRTINAPIEDGDFVTATNGDVISITSEPLTLDKELNEHFAYLAHQDFMQPTPDLSRLSDTNWVVNKKKVESEITSSEAKINFTKRIPIDSVTDSTTETVASGDPLFMITANLEVYRDGAAIKHRYSYKVEGFNEEAKQILEKVLSPSYKLLGALGENDNPIVISQLKHFIDDLNDLEAIPNSELLPTIESCPWNVVTLLANIKKLLIDLNEEKEKIQKADGNLEQVNLRISRMQTFYEKVFTEYKDRIEDDFNRGIYKIFVGIHDPIVDRKGFDRTLEQFKALIEDFNLINDRPTSEETIFAIIRNRMRYDSISEGKFIAITHILKAKRDESDPLKETLDLYQKAIVEFVKMDIEKKANRLEDPQIKSSISNFLDMVNNSDLDMRSKASLMMVILNGLNKNKIEEVLLKARDRFMLFEAETLNTACTAFKKELSTRLEKIAQKDMSVAVTYLNAPRFPGVTYQPPVERMIEGYEEKEKSITKLAQENTEFKMLLEKYQSLTTAQRQLDSRRDNPEAAMERFEASFRKQKRTIEKSEDGATIKFLKVVATVLSFGLAYEKLWKTAGHEFSSQINTFFSSSKKRKSEFEQRESENAKKIKSESEAEEKEKGKEKKEEKEKEIEKEEEEEEQRKPPHPD